LSEGGAGLAGALALPVGSGSTLTVDAIGFPLPFIVKFSEGETLRLAFALDPAIASRFRGRPERLGRLQAA
jgi:hypothetical protein